MIPKILHYVWLGGKTVPEKFQAYIAGWKKLMPDYTVMEWTERNFDFSASKYAVQAYECKKYGFTADYIRVAVLERYGGIYLDTDVEAFKPFDEFLNEQFFTGFENDVYVQTAVLGSEAHHPLLKELLNFYLKVPFAEGGKVDLTPNPFYLTYFLRRDYKMILQASTQHLTAGGGVYGNRVRPRILCARRLYHGEGAAHGAYLRGASLCQQLVG